MKRCALLATLLFLSAAPAEAKLSPVVAQMYARDKLEVMVPLYAYPTPGYKLDRCQRVNNRRFKCRFKVYYLSGQTHRGTIRVLWHRHVKPGYTRLGFRIEKIPDPPKPSLRRGLGDF